MKKFVVLLSFLICLPLLSQTTPSAYKLINGNYSLNAWSADIPAGNYPPSMMFHTTKTRDALLTDEMDADWIMGYNLTSRSRIVGLEDLGFGFQNTSSLQADSGAYLGAAVLALDAFGRGDIEVNWIGRTINPSERQYAIILQYRIHSEDAFVSLESNYVADLQADKFLQMPKLTLPAKCYNEPLVELRWKYYYTGQGLSGTRPNLAVDDIYITSSVYNSVGDCPPERLIIRNNAAMLDNNGEINSYQIFDILGNMVVSENQATSNTVRLERLPKGIYLLRVYSLGRLFTKIVII